MTEWFSNRIALGVEERSSVAQLERGDESFFDVWLEGSLRRLYGEIAAEPLPAELAALVGDPKIRR
jgi:hypothetical protein